MNARQVFLLHASHDCYHNARNWGANGVRNGVCNVTERRSISFACRSVSFRIYRARSTARSRSAAFFLEESQPRWNTFLFPRRVFRSLGRLHTTRRSPGTRFSKVGVTPDRSNANRCRRRKTNRTAFDGTVRAYKRNDTRGKTITPPRKLCGNYARFIQKVKGHGNQGEHNITVAREDETTTTQQTDLVRLAGTPSLPVMPSPPHSSTVLLQLSPRRPSGHCGGSRVGPLFSSPPLSGQDPS